MANEALKRTPTSTGNRKVWTWSGWVKRNKLGANQYIFNRVFLSSSNFELYYSNNDNLYVADYVSGYKIQLVTRQRFRDTSSWQHILLSIDTTSSTASDRVKLYVNGVRITDFSTETYPIINLETQWNNTQEHEFSDSGGAYDILAELTDVFMIDGQALTPDVFGFYKQGNGYISAGSTQSTDFRPGQWVPKTPRVIKAQIERNGGFGVNGYYLPMNDSSNFGADFHTTPNSIITLKGEDLPQPRNGLPTTSDNYVSQLRTDPYAANLVLAVPGVNTQPTGSELVTNGTFDNDVSGWTITDTGTLVRQSDGTVKVTRGTSARVAYQDITTVVGTTYELSVDITAIAGSHGQIYVYSTDHSGILDTNIGYSFYTGTYKGTFTADTTTTRIALYAHPSGSTSYDNVSVKATTIPDYSADIKGSGTNKTLTPVGDAGVRSPNDTSGSAVHGYYGSALSFDGSGDYFTLPANTSDLLLGSSDFTIECWVNRTASGQQDAFGLYQTANNRRSYLLTMTDSQVIFYLNETGSSGINATASLNVPLNQWTHLVGERNGSNLSLYVNGVACGINTLANFSAYNNTVDSFMIGASDYSIANGSEFTGYIQDLRVYKGVAKYKGGFDVPKPYTPVGIESWRAVPDCTANNFATLNPLIGAGVNAGDTVPALVSGNLYLDNANQTWAPATIGVSTGKYYAEFMCLNGAFGSYIGVCGDSIASRNSQDFFNKVGVSHIRLSSSSLTKSFTSTSLTSGSIGYTSGDIVGVTLDVTNKEIKFFKNNVGIFTDTTLSGFTTTNTHYYFTSFRTNDGSSGADWSDVIANFGQNPTFSGNTTSGTYTDSNGKGLFKYEPPSGFLALCEDNLPTPAIKNPGEYFKTALYTGSNISNGVGRSPVTGVGFKPDLIWIKCRDAAQNHVLYDSVRGLQCLNSNNAGAESTFESQILGGYDEDGFTTSPNNDSNYLGKQFTAWCWRAGAGTTSTNTDGTIPSVVSVNQDAGFSIVSYTGNGSTGSVGHGLGKAPKFIIYKHRESGVRNWLVDIGSITGTTGDYVYLNSTAGKLNSANVLGASSSVLNLGNTPESNEAYKFIAYCWAEIEGFSKFGSYVGNNNADGPAVYCGFKPALVIFKRTDTTSDWIIMDSSRESVNPNSKWLYPNLSYFEEDGASRYVDLLSNGFKIRNTGTGTNASGGTYIFAAWAESPFQTANAK